MIKILLHHLRTETVAQVSLTVGCLTVGPLLDLEDMLLADDSPRKLRQKEEPSHQ